MDAGRVNLMGLSERSNVCKKKKNLFKPSLKPLYGSKEPHAQQGGRGEREKGGGAGARIRRRSSEPCHLDFLPFQLEASGCRFLLGEAYVARPLGLKL